MRSSGCCQEHSHFKSLQGPSRLVKNSPDLEIKVPPSLLRSSNRKQTFTSWVRGCVSMLLNSASEFSTHYGLDGTSCGWWWGWASDNAQLLWSLFSEKPLMEAQPRSFATKELPLVQQHRAKHGWGWEQGSLVKVLSSQGGDEKIQEIQEKPWWARLSSQPCASRTVSYRCGTPQFQAAWEFTRSSQGRSLASQSSGFL